MSRWKRLCILIFIDGIFIYFSIFFSFLITGINQSNYKWIFFFSLIFTIPFYIISKGYKGLTKYIGSQELYSLSLRNLLALFIIYVTSLLFQFKTPPINLWIILYLLLLISTGSIRFILRDILTSQFLELKSDLKKVAIYGAGSAGAQLYASIILANSHNVITFIDDSPRLKGRTLNNIAIHSSDYLEKAKEKISLILLAIPSLKSSKRKEIINNIQSKRIPILQVPSIEDITSGKSKINELKPILIEELLGRNIVNPDKNILNQGISDKVILITGGGGSIGGELCRQIIKFNPKKLIVLERHEYSIYLISEELKKINKNNINLKIVLGSSTNEKLVEDILKKEKIDFIFHAAAYKHVPIVESNPLAGIYNNIISTKIICSQANKFGVKKVILVSTDKAVRPTNVMGASKRLAEIIFQLYSNQKCNIDNSNKKITFYSIVRFGNVLDSSGSVIPLFRKQIKEGGPITLTHPQINRYFMTIKEAAELVIQSAVLSKGGEVFLLDMGSPVKIKDLAEKMILLTGLNIKDEFNKNGDIEIIETGLRPGEKIFEELLINSKAEKTIHPLIYRAKEPFNYNSKTLEIIKKLEINLNKNEYEKSLNLLSKLVPEWKTNNLKY